jgi:uncharacterized membrane protein
VNQSAATSEDQLLTSIRWAVEQYQQKNYMPAVGVLIMVVVFLSRKYLNDKIQDEYMPLFSATTGVLVAVATNLTALAVGSTQTDWISAVVSGVATGAMASGLWSLGGKKLLKKSKK